MNETKPTRVRDDLSHFQAIPIGPLGTMKKRARRQRAGCLVAALVLLAAYLLSPGEITILILGIDRAPQGTALGRSDTIILLGARPLTAEVNMLSIPRDLWVEIPGYGEERINAAHFFAEAEEAGSGPAAAAETVRANFAVEVDHTVRIQLENFAGVVDALGGITLTLERPMAGYPAGEITLMGEEALAFVRSRAGTDDFQRMQQGQVFLVSLFKQMLRPKSWVRIPAFLIALGKVVDVDMPVWQYPRLALALLRAGPAGLELETLTREMVTPFTTNLGAQVLLPNWSQIMPFVRDRFEVVE